METPLWLLKLRYPMPEEGDFVEDLPLDKYVQEDHDDNKAANKEKK
jgi:hypothetical protein